MSDTHRPRRVLRPKKGNYSYRGSTAKRNVTPKNSEEYSPPPQFLLFPRSAVIGAG
jgi:hypothetical protein